MFVSITMVRCGNWWRRDLIAIHRIPKCHLQCCVCCGRSKSFHSRSTCTCTMRMRDAFHSFEMSISQHNEHFCLIEPVALGSMTELKGIQNSIITSTNETSFHLTEMTAFDGTLISCCYNIPDFAFSPSLSRYPYPKSRASKYENLPHRIETSRSPEIHWEKLSALSIK